MARFQVVTATISDLTGSVWPPSAINLLSLFTTLICLLLSFWVAATIFSIPFPSAKMSPEPAPILETPASTQPANKKKKKAKKRKTTGAEPGKTLQPEENLNIDQSGAKESTDAVNPDHPPTLAAIPDTDINTPDLPQKDENPSPEAGELVPAAAETVATILDDQGPVPPAGESKKVTKLKAKQQKFFTGRREQRKLEYAAQSSQMMAHADPIAGDFEDGTHALGKEFRPEETGPATPVQVTNEQSIHLEPDSAGAIITQPTEQVTSGDNQEGAPPFRASSIEIKKHAPKHTRNLTPIVIPRTFERPKSSININTADLSEQIPKIVVKMPEEALDLPRKAIVKMPDGPLRPARDYARDIPQMTADLIRVIQKQKEVVKQSSDEALRNLAAAETSFKHKQQPTRPIDVKKQGYLSTLDTYNAARSGTQSFPASPTAPETISDWSELPLSMRYVPLKHTEKLAIQTLESIPQFLVAASINHEETATTDVATPRKVPLIDRMGFIFARTMANARAEAANGTFTYPAKQSSTSEKHESPIVKSDVMTSRQVEIFLAGMQEVKDAHDLNRVVMRRYWRITTPSLVTQGGIGGVVAACTMSDELRGRPSFLAKAMVSEDLVADLICEIKVNKDGVGYEREWNHRDLE